MTDPYESLTDVELRERGYEPTPQGLRVIPGSRADLNGQAGDREHHDVEHHDVDDPRLAPVGLGALSRAAALDRIKLVPTEFVVEGIIATMDYGTLAGPKGVGKTLALEDMAVSVALGEPWLGRWPTIPGAVMRIATEAAQTAVATALAEVMAEAEAEVVAADEARLEILERGHL